MCWPYSVSPVVCRYQGGLNAGHTIVVGDETFKICQTPSGVISGKTSVIGAGRVVDPQVLLDSSTSSRRAGSTRRSSSSRATPI